MQHLEEIARSTTNHRYDTFLKNVLYGRFDEQGRSLGGILRDPLSWKGLIRATTAERFIGQLDLVRQAKYPVLSEFVTLLEYSVRVASEMVQEANTRGYFGEDQMEIQRIDARVIKAAQLNTDFVREKFRSDLKAPIRPSAQYKEGGFQAADMLRQYCQAYDLRHDHIQFLMKPDGCLDVLVTQMQEMESRRIRAGGDQWPQAKVFKNHKLFVTDLTDVRQDEARVLLDNKSMSVVNRNLVLNPSLSGRGPRRDVLGLNPYVSVENFIDRFINTHDTFLDVCLAYNLFGLTEVWFSEFPLERWDQLTWDMFNDRDLLSVLVNETYPNTVRLTEPNFDYLQADIQRAFSLSVKAEAQEDPYGGMQTIHLGDYNEPGQQWASHGTPGEYSSSEGEFGMKRAFYGEDLPSDAMFGSFTIEPSNTLLYGILAAGGGALLYYNS